MKITVLGSGSAFSSVRRFNSCYFVEAGKNRFLIDCGSDAMRAMQKAEIDFFSVDRIFITHMHADHSAGLPAVLTAMHVLGRKQPLKVYLPFTQIDFAKLWLANMFIFVDRLTFEVTLLPLSPGNLELEGGVGLEFIQTKHLDKYLEYAAPLGIVAVSFSVLVTEGKKKFFFSSDLASLEEASGYMEGGVSFVEATHPPLEEVAAISGRRSSEVYFTHIPRELEEGGEWRRDLAIKFGIKELRSVHDGQVIVI
ncbi:MAG TPA: ribonuclease Z [Candidatus Kryptobacter bacterium]|nr:ribonuclease Z [Candidatus Kryptobacter bacterium]